MRSFYKRLNLAFSGAIVEASESDKLLKGIVDYAVKSYSDRYFTVVRDEAGRIGDLMQFRDGFYFPAAMLADYLERAEYETEAQRIRDYCDYVEGASLTPKPRFGGTMGPDPSEDEQLLFANRFGYREQMLNLIRRVVGVIGGRKPFLVPHSRRIVDIRPNDVVSWDVEAPSWYPDLNGALESDSPDLRWSNGELNLSVNPPPAKAGEVLRLTGRVLNTDWDGDDSMDDVSFLVRLTSPEPLVNLLVWVNQGWLINASFTDRANLHDVRGAWGY